jgi:hypothetical protein
MATIPARSIYGAGDGNRIASPNQKSFALMALPPSQNSIGVKWSQFQFLIKLIHVLAVSINWA